jgi:DeoR family glycerol-3-phosphate regulon repressor
MEPMSPQERHSRIIEMLGGEGRVTVEEFARRLQVSRETIRRDLNVLSEKGRLRKFHGGAELMPVDAEGAFKERLSQNAPAKRAIARCAAALFRPGDSLFVDTGTTTVFFAEELARVGGVSVITNSATIASIMVADEARNRVYLLGGEYYGDASESLGPLTVEQIAAFRADHVVLTVGALDAATGVMDYLLEEAQVARAMIGRAKRLTVLADSSKLRRIALFEVCPLSRVDTLVVDEAPEEGLAAALEKEGVQLVVAGSRR